MSGLRLSHFVAVLAASALSLGIAGTAHAKLIGFHGTLSIGLPGLPPVVATGVGQAILNSSAGIGGHLTTLQILSNSVAITGAIVPITDPSTPVVSVRGTAALGTGVLRPISGAAASGTGLTQNVIPVPGSFRFCILFTGCPSSLPVPLTVGGTRGMGIGGLITLGTFGKGQVKFSIYGQPWTVGTALVTGIATDNGGFSTASAFGFAHGPASGTSSTAEISGVIQLVTATRIFSKLNAGTVSPLLTTLRIHLVPEPGTFVLFGSGVVALGVAGHRRLGR